LASSPVILIVIDPPWYKRIWGQIMLTNSLEYFPKPHRKLLHTNAWR
jgi:hypothetical protein